jgi:hypothetical protein
MKLRVGEEGEGKAHGTGCAGVSASGSINDWEKPEGSGLQKCGCVNPSLKQIVGISSRGADPRCYIFQCVAKLMVDILGGNLTHHNESPRLSTLTEQ